jgi:TctA family transporter
MDLFNNLAIGFATAGTFNNLLYCFIGVALGTLIGVLPGIGPLATIAMLLPATYKMADPTTALIMLAGIYYGAQYGGSTTAILVNLPGESSSVVTTLDGYQMARKGRAGPALAIAGIGSFFAGTVATFLLAAFAPPLAEIPLRSKSIKVSSVELPLMLRCNIVGMASFNGVLMVMFGCVSSCVRRCATSAAA